VDIRLEQGETDLPQRSVNLPFGELPVAAKPLEYCLKPIGQALKHWCALWEKLNIKL